jgi:hypothetical protein
VLLAATLVATSPVFGHHSPIIFDADAIVVVQGPVSRFDWTNPHVYIFVETTDDIGRTVEWQFETDATPILRRNGWTPGSLTTGDRVSVRANPDRLRGRAHALLISLEKDDGTVLTPTSGDPNAPTVTPPAAGLSGIWEQRFENFLEFYARAANVATTEKGTAARAQYDVRSENPVAACIAYPSPTIVAAPQYLNELTVHDDRVTIHSEFYDVERTIYLDGRGHPENGERTNQGHSIGWWDGDALVVDTTLFADHRSTLPGTGLPSGAQKHVVERYALSDDGTGILIDFTLEDPEYLTEPFTGTLEWRYLPHLKMAAFDCDLEQATRFMFEPPGR